MANSQQHGITTSSPSMLRPRAHLCENRLLTSLPHPTRSSTCSARYRGPCRLGHRPACRWDVPACMLPARGLKDEEGRAHSRREQVRAAGRPAQECERCQARTHLEAVQAKMQCNATTPLCRDSCRHASHCASFSKTTSQNSRGVERLLHPISAWTRPTWLRSPLATQYRRMPGASGDAVASSRPSGLQHRAGTLRIKA